MKIQEVSRELKCSSETLRYYERIGLIPKVACNQDGVREYTRENIEWIQLIRKIKASCLPCETMIEYVKLLPVTSETCLPCKEVLLEQIREIEKKKDELEVICECLNSRIQDTEKWLNEKEKSVMSKNILVLSGSARLKGNSSRLCDQFIQGAQESGHQVEKINVHEQNIQYCIGCGACQVEGGVCIHKDDMAKIMEKMIQSDIIVMATPVYFYSMNGQMKTLIDRVCPRYTEMSNKDFYLMLSAADEDKSALQHTLDGFQGFFDCLENPNLAGIVYGVNATEIGDIEGSEAMEAAYKMGKAIH